MNLNKKMNSNIAKKFNSNNNNKSPITKKLKNINLSAQSLSSTKKNLNKKEKYQINCSQTLDRKELNYNNINNENEEELSIIQSLWDDLGVYIDYQEEFKEYIKELKNDEQKNEILNYEKNHLCKFREALLKLSSEITNRDNTIFKIKKYCKELDKYSLNKTNSEEDFPPNIFENIKKTIKLYRISTVNVINKIMRLREISSYYELTKKWDPALSNSSYLYKKNYILSMFNDIKFINKSILFNFLETDNGHKKTDLFFSNCKYLITNDGTKIKLPISLELQNAISKCKYIILQDTLLNNIKNDKKLIRTKNIFSFKTTRLQSTKPKKSQSEIYLINDQGEKKYYEMFGHNKVNLSRTLYYLKRTMGNDYEKMFYSSNKKNSDKKNLEVMNKYFSFRQSHNDIKDNDIMKQNSNRKKKGNLNENIIKEQINKNEEDIKEYNSDNPDHNIPINNKNKENNNTGIILENTTYKESNNINIDDNSAKKEGLNNILKEENVSPIKKENKEENTIETNNKENHNLVDNTINNDTEIKKENLKEKDTIEQNNQNKENILESKNENNEENINIKQNDNNNKEINSENNFNKNNESIEGLDKLKEKEKINESKKSEGNKDDLNEGKNKEIKNNESIEEKDKNREDENIENYKKENDEIEKEYEKENENLLNNKEKGEFQEEKKDENNKKNEKENENDINNISQGEFQEKSEDENIKKDENENDNKKDKISNGQSEFQEVNIDNKNDDKIKNEINNSPKNEENEKEGNSTKVKLLQYRQYTEEELKKLNKNDDDDDFISVDYDKI